MKIEVLGTMTEMRLDYDEALELCEQVRTINKNKKISFSKMWCWGCAKFTISPDKRCFANAENGSNTGCSQVNKLYTELQNSNK